MAAKHPTIGIMITEADRDIAAWFNMMRGHNPSIWVAGMIAAWEMGETLKAGTIVPKKAAPTPTPAPLSSPTLLFGSGQARTTPSPVQTSAPKYGWTVRGSKGEYIVGSVINVSIARQELAPIIARLKAGHTQLAPFVKALIRSGVTIGETEQRPDVAALNDVLGRYRLSLAPKPPAAQKFLPIRHG